MIINKIAEFILEKRLKEMEGRINRLEYELKKTNDYVDKNIDIYSYPCILGKFFCKKKPINPPIVKTPPLKTYLDI